MVGFGAIAAHGREARAQLAPVRNFLSASGSLGGPIRDVPPRLSCEWANSQSLRSDPDGDAGAL